jgi:predicted transcriptional regulator
MQSMSDKRKNEATRRPTDAELAILRVLWERGPSTVREVHQALSSSQGSGYTTVLKQLQVMTEKGLVVRDEAQRAHVYLPKLSEQRTQRQLLRDLVDRAYAGSSAKLVLQALAGQHSTAKERSDIRALLDELEKGDSK